MSQSASPPNGTAASTQDDIKFTPDHPFPEFQDFVKSHFSHGIITFHPGYLFRTPEGWSMWAGGPPNHVKDGVQPLAGLVETDWLPFPFTMNWVFTRPGRVKFAQGRAVLFHHPGAGPAAGTVRAGAEITDP